MLASEYGRGIGTDVPSPPGLSVTPSHPEKAAAMQGSWAPSIRDRCPPSAGLCLLLRMCSPSPGYWLPGSGLFSSTESKHRKLTLLTPRTSRKGSCLVSLKTSGGVASLLVAAPSLQPVDRSHRGSGARGHSALALVFRMLEQGTGLRSENFPPGCPSEQELREPVGI